MAGKRQHIRLQLTGAGVSGTVALTYGGATDGSIPRPLRSPELAVDFWSNGDFSGTSAGPIDYGVAVATHDTVLDYSGGVSVTPELGALGLLSSGLLGMLVWQRRAARRSLPVRRSSNRI